MITLTSLVSRVQEISAVVMQDDLGMMSLETGKYYYTNSIGRDIWEQLEEPITPIHLVDRLLEIYEVDKLTCLAETLEFLQLINDQKLLIIHE